MDPKTILSSFLFYVPEIYCGQWTSGTLRLTQMPMRLITLREIHFLASRKIEPSKVIKGPEGSLLRRGKNYLSSRHVSELEGSWKRGEEGRKRVGRMGRMQRKNGAVGRRRRRRRRLTAEGQMRWASETRAVHIGWLGCLAPKERGTDARTLTTLGCPSYWPNKRDLPPPSALSPSPVYPSITPHGSTSTRTPGHRRFGAVPSSSLTCLC